VPIYLAVAIVLIVLYALGRRLFSGALLAPRAFWCPFRSTDVRVDFKEATWDGSLLDVETCTAFTPPGDVQCDKACLALKTLPTPRAEPSVQARVPETASWP
jgi:hypothetical protein